MQYQQEEHKINNVKDIFVREDEQEKAVIGGGYLKDLLHTGVLNKGFGIVTNRRFYFKGTCYHKVGNGFTMTNEERIVDLQDITSSGFTYTKNVLWLILSYIGFLWGVYATILLIMGINDNVALMFILGWLPDIILWIIYILSKIVIYEVSFAGGAIAVKSSSYGVKELRDFDKKLRLAKDEFLEKNK